MEEKEERQAEKRARVSLYPSPRYCSQQEQDVLGACLTRWAQELHQEMDGESMWMETHCRVQNILTYTRLEVSTEFYSVFGLKLRCLYFCKCVESYSYDHLVELISG